MESATCLSTLTLYDYASCASTNWLARLNTRLITPYSQNSTNVFTAYSDGFVGYGASVTDSLAVRPVLYLEDEVLVREGLGTYDEPYQMFVY